MIAFLNELPEYDIALYTNKKNKLTAESSKELLQKETDALTALTEWSYDSTRCTVCPGGSRRH